MTAAFHEILFPLDIALKSAGGPERRTDIVALGSGREERNARWAHSRRRYDAGYGVKTFEALGAVVAFFEERRGRLHGFRWRDRLNQPSGRRYTAACSADLGDSRCTVDLGGDAFRGSGVIAALKGTSAFVASGLDAFADGWFSAGRLAWSGGANAGLAVEVKRHRVADGAVAIELWQAMPEPLAPGDSFVVTAGCDKRFDTCRNRFDNAINFRGFPHIPGNDFVARYAVSGEPGNTGKSLQS
jgi:uncharacterized phage protein (TIGR02218 family)